MNEVKTDQELIKECRSGQEAAFGELVKRYEGLAYTLAYNVVYDADAARDISQEAWLKIYLNLQKFDLTQNFTPWLYRIVSNAGIDYLRHRRPKPAQEILERTVARTANPAMLAEVSERQGIIRALLQKVPLKYRMALVLSDIDEMNSEEMGEILKCPAATARWRVFQGRKIFKELWEKYGMDKESV